MKYNLSQIMRRAWSNVKKLGLSLSEALHRSWLSAKAEPINTARVTAAATEAGVAEPVNTWSAWKRLGREVIHGAKALFTVSLIYGSRGDGATYTASFFSESQTKPIEE